MPLLTTKKYATLTGKHPSMKHNPELRSITKYQPPPRFPKPFIKVHKPCRRPRYFSTRMPLPECPTERNGRVSHLYHVGAERATTARPSADFRFGLSLEHADDLADVTNARTTLGGPAFVVGMGSGCLVSC